MTRRASLRGRKPIARTLRQNDRHLVQPIRISPYRGKVAEREGSDGLATQYARKILGCDRCLNHSLDSQKRKSGHDYRRVISASLIGVVNDVRMTRRAWGGGLSETSRPHRRTPAAINRFLSRCPRSTRARAKEENHE